jgi:hypothetical protein
MDIFDVLATPHTIRFLSDGIEPLQQRIGCKGPVAVIIRFDHSMKNTPNFSIVQGEYDAPPIY